MLEEIIEKSLERVVPGTADFRDSEGFLCCGKCGQRREKKIEFDFGKGPVSRIVGIQCRCGAEEERQRAEQIKVQQEAERRTHSLMDPAFKDCYFSEFKKTRENEENFSICRNYAENFDACKASGYGLLMTGPVGTGKTYAASCVSNHILSSGHSVLFTNMPRILSRIESDRQAEENLLERLKTVDLLVLDDIGAERTTSYAAEKMFAVVDARYRAKRPIIVTSNLSIQDMQQETDLKYQRSFDRLFEMCLPMTWIGRNWRRNDYQKRVSDMRATIFGETKIPFAEATS